MAINLNIISKFDDSGVKKVTGELNGLGKVVGGLAAGIAAAFSVKAIVDFGKQAVLAAEGVATANARIDNISKSMGLFGNEADAVTDRLIQFAEANEMIVATDAEVIKQTQATLLTFKELAATAGEAGSSFDRATLAAVDLAAAGFGTAETNAIQLGKALNDPIKGITALTRSGVTFTEAEKEKIATLVESGNMLEAQNMILSAIETQVGGTAAATANMSDMMGLAFDNISETVGAALLPAFEQIGESVIPLIQEILPKLTSWLEEKLAPAAQAAADSITNLIDRFREGESIGEILAGMFQSVLNWFSGGGPEEIFARAMEIRQSITQAILEAIPGILEGLVALLPAVLEFITGTLIPQMVGSLTFLLTELSAIFAEVMPQLIQAITNIVPDLVQAVADLTPVIVGTLLGMLPTILQAGMQLFNELVDAVVEITPQLIDTIIDLLPQLVDSIVSMLPGILQASIDLFHALVSAIPVILPLLIDAVFDLLPEITDALISMVRPLTEAAVDVFFALVEAVPMILPDLIPQVLGLIPKITEALVGAVPALIEAGIELLKGLAIGMVENSGRILGDAVKEVGNFLVNGVKDFFDIKSPSGVFMEIGENIGDGMAVGIESKIGTVAASAKKLAEAAVPAGYEWVMGPNGPYLESSAFVSGKSNKGVSDFGAASASFLLRQQGLSQEEIDRVLTQTIGGTLNQVNATMNKGVTLINKATNTMVMGNLTAADVADRVAQGFDVVEKIATPVADLEKAVSELVGKIQAGDTAYLKPMATGGIVTGPTPALIGEAGPEAVIPLSRLGDMGGPTYNITVNAGIGTDGGDVGRQIVEAIKRYERRSGKVFAAV